MCSCAIEVINSRKGRIEGLSIVGFDIGVKASNSHDLVIENLTTNKCATGIILEDSWGSDIKGVNIKNQPFGFKLTNLFIAITRVNSPNL